MVPMLLEQYARSGSERARRNMLAMSEDDPELFAEVLAHFVAMAGEKMNKVREELLNFLIQILYSNVSKTSVSIIL